MIEGLLNPILKPEVEDKSIAILTNRPTLQPLPLIPFYGIGGRSVGVLLFIFFLKANN